MNAWETMQSLGRDPSKVTRLRNGAKFEYAHTYNYRICGFYLDCTGARTEGQWRPNGYISGKKSDQFPELALDWGSMSLAKEGKAP
jgi:hypothetical protein